MFSENVLKYFQYLPTPFYYYDVEVLKATLEKAKAAASLYNFSIHYALKANVNDKILTIISQHGLGVDCVSGNEIKKAIETGFNPNVILFAGVGKTDEEIKYALSLGIFYFNCESLEEIKVINELAVQQNTIAPISLRINPNVNAYTHNYITTGLEENKFGIGVWELDAFINLLPSLNNIELLGLHFHIGSQITKLEVFKELCMRVNEIQNFFSIHNILFQHINLGGGLGVDYHHPDENIFPDFESYFRIFYTFLEKRPGQQLHVELGRAIVAQCGNLIARVLYIKKGLNTYFAIIDAGMTELIRPALYQSYHKIENLSKFKQQYNLQKYSIVGPVCESSDCFGKTELPETARGDLIAIRTAGAYGEVMTSSYNLRNKPQAFYSDELKTKNEVL